MASALSPRHAEVQELRAVEEYIRREREECEMLERQIVAMAVDAGIPSGSAAEEELGEDPYARPQRSGAKQVAAQGSAPVSGSSGSSSSTAVVPHERSAAEGARDAAASLVAAHPHGVSSGSMRRSVSPTATHQMVTRGGSTVAVLLPRTRRTPAKQQAVPGRAGSGRKLIPPSFSRAQRFKGPHAIAQTTASPGPGAYNTMHSDFSGCPGVVGAEAEAAESRVKAAIAGGAEGAPSPPKPAAGGAAADGAGPSHGGRRNPLSQAKLVAQLEASQAREKELRRQLASTTRRVDEARGQLTAFQNQTRTRLRDAEALAARRSAVVEAARGRVAAMRKAFAEIERAAHSLPASGDGRPAESAPESPEAELQLTVEQKVRYVFAFYLGFGQRDKEINAMRHTGWARFTRAAGIVPHLLSPADVDIAFSKEVAHRTAGTQLGGALVFEQFIAALADLATRIHRGPEAAPDDEEDHNALRSLLESHVLPLFDELCNDATFIQEVVNVGATDDLEAFADEFLSPGVIAFLNGNKGALSSLFQRFAMIEDPGKPPRGSPQAAAAALASPSPDGVLRAMQERHAGWQELQRSNRQMSRWAFGQFISAMKLAPGVLNRRDLINIFRQANRGVAQDDFPDALSYPEFVEVLALVARSAYAADTAFVTLVDRLMLLFYDMAQRGADFVGEELRLVRSVSRVVKQRLAEAESSREADTQAAAAHQRSVISSVMASVDADSHAGANGTVSEPTTPEARP
ncbi:hypothetical protein FNF28_05509 [Cafeteria roenbergensis]|uniref:EF-hand domain-containing protein n=1 Tax=Cafeteria roenbergensis TaxID=33653 RepID=A0A5A8D4A8_CAFRO|nr:hypothetical protein FNF28_05509 [Cafeteria roenbergensis]